MNTTMKIKTAVMSMALVMAYSTASAQRPHYFRHWYGARTVVVRPGTSYMISNRFTMQDRLAMAVAYLKNNRTLTARRYARMTGLSVSMAEAELEAFAADHKKPIVAVAKNKKRVYALA